MLTFLAIYRGKTVSDAQLLAVSADEQLVQRVAAELLNTTNNSVSEDCSDPAIAALVRGRRAALRLISTREGSNHA